MRRDELSGVSEVGACSYQLTLALDDPSAPTHRSLHSVAAHSLTSTLTRTRRTTLH
jgi:hypothetical protein